MKKLSLVLAVVLVSVLLASASWAAYPGVNITPMQALDISFKHAGADANTVVDVSVELETSRGKLVYDVEFEFGGFDYDYHIDAETGDVLRHRKELD